MQRSPKWFFRACVGLEKWCILTDQYMAKVQKYLQTGLNTNDFYIISV